MAEEKLVFQAEVSRLLDIVAHALYSEREVFLRELISNASDACDRRRYLSLTEPEKAETASHYQIEIAPDKNARTLLLSDNGIGMSREELVENLGTIARSGTARFVEQLSGDARKDMSLIGQFGVGFYSAFMVAQQVEVISRKAAETVAWRWHSDGQGAFTVAQAERAECGTSIILHLRADADEFLDEHRLRQIVKRYSDHIALPIILKQGAQTETLNSASALWARSRSEISDRQLKEFYHHVAHENDDPWASIHVRAEGTLEYSALLFIPKRRPFDLFTPERKHGVKLYVRRVFITDDCADLIPGWLRFLRGVVDSADLPLNISREMLQNNPMLTKIRGNLIKKTLAELEKKAEEPDYKTFWENFGAVLKEGLYETPEYRETVLKLSRFRSTAGQEFHALDAYIERMKPGQEAIYTASGEDMETLLASPHLEGFRAKGVEVLLLTDSVDEFWPSAIGHYKDKPFRSITRGGADLGKIEGANEDKADKAETKLASDDLVKLIALLKLHLGDKVKDVRESERLTDSAVCLIADEGDMDMRLERLLRQHKQLDRVSLRVLEINPRHPVITGLAANVGHADEAMKETALLLFDQALILEGEALPDARAFARRLDLALLRALK